MTNLATVRLYIYDISFGLASAFGSTLLGRPIDGVWHTGVGVYGREYLFGSSGVSYTAPEEIHRQGLAPKPRALDLGTTKKSLSEVQAWISEKSGSNFRGYRYDLLDWNCNNFSDEFTKFLLDSSRSLIPEEILELPRIVKTTPLGRMLLSFLNKDPISAAQQSGSANNSSTEYGMHMVSSATNTQSKSDQIPARHSILPKMDKMERRVAIIEKTCSRKLSAKEKEQLNDIQQLLIPNANYSPLLTTEHFKLLISLMINSIQDETGQRTVLEVLQLLSECEYVIKILGELKGEESPIGLLRGLLEQSETIQINFLRWFSCIAATSNGRTFLINLQDDYAQIFVDIILNESVSRKVKYEVAVVLHNLLCINTDLRLSQMNTIAIGSALVQYLSVKVTDEEAETYLAVFTALGDAEADFYGIARAMDFDPDVYSSVAACRPLIRKIQNVFKTI